MIPYLWGYSIHLERTNIHCKSIVYTRSVYMGLKSTKGQNLECLNEQQIIFYKYFENLVMYES
jgi:hypothetical protein